MNPSVYTVIVNWNGGSDILECLQSLSTVSYPNNNVIVVDNGSQDGSLELIAIQFPDAILLPQGRNIGYSEACNLAAKYALERNADYVFLLNSDAVATPHVVDKLVECMETDRAVGVAGALNQKYNFPHETWTGTPPHGISLVIEDMSKCPLPSGEQSTEIQDYPYVTGSAMMIRADLIRKIKLYDSRFFAYYEDTDLCMRAIRNGFRVVLVHSAVVRHKVAQSLGDGSLRQHYYMARNVLLFFANHATFAYWMRFLPNFLYAYFLMPVKRLVRHREWYRVGQVVVATQASFDFVTRKFGQHSKLWMSK